MVYYCTQKRELDINAVNSEGQTALHFIVQSEICRLSCQDKITAFRHLVSSGAAVNITDKLGNTLPLHGAADEGFLEIVQFLIEPTDINIEAVTSEGCMPLQLAAGCGH